MATRYILYNPKAGHATEEKDSRLFSDESNVDLKWIDISQIEDYRAFFSALSPEDEVVLCGGDGTLNCFVNSTEGIAFRNQILYYPTGTGNDFAHDLGYQKGCSPFLVNEYIKDLPIVTVKNKKYHFINGIGYGIDGYCCEVGDQLKEANKKVNYTTIALKGLFFYYKPTNATVTVDGVTRRYQKVWMAPTMNGRYFGGGMMPTPNQDRCGKDKTLSIMIVHDSSRLKTLTFFPTIFKGEHVKHTEIVDILTGHEITVTFDRPTALQIDGETILDVLSYTATSAAVASETQEEAREEKEAVLIG